MLNRKASNDDALIRRVIDQLVTEEEFAAFNKRLLSDPALRQRYVHTVELECDLREEFGETDPTPTYASSPRSRRWSMSGWWVVASIALIVNIVWLANGKDLLQDKVTQESAESTRNTVPEEGVREPQPGFTPYPTDSTQVEDAAVIVRLNETVDPKLHVGMRLKSGVLNLTRGEIQIEFVSGAILALAAPAELSIRSKNVATLISGLATVRVPPRARGFVLNAPDTAIVDLGTEFGVRIDESGTSEVEVTSGEVHLSLLGDDGNTLVSQLVGESENFRVDGREKELVRVEASTQLPQISFANDAPLPVTDAYIDAVRNQFPVLYWRFENESDGLIANDVSADWSGDIHRAATAPDSIKVLNGHVRFDRADAPRYLLTRQRIPHLNESSYSIEFWMNPDDLHHSTCLGLFPDDRAYIHLNVVEIATETELIHAPGAIRFLHRNPPAKSKERGTNVYSSGLCTPGQWQHVVAVKNGPTLLLYFNGQLANRVMTKEPDSDEEFHFILGQLNLFETERQFVGSMDEVAIYDHALTPSVIKQHYKLISGEASNQEKR